MRPGRIRPWTVGLVALMIAIGFSIKVLADTGWDPTIFTAFGETATPTREFAEAAARRPVPSPRAGPRRKVLLRAVARSSPPVPGAERDGAGPTALPQPTHALPVVGGRSWHLLVVTDRLGDVGGQYLGHRGGHLRNIHHRSTHGGIGVVGPGICIQHRADQRAQHLGGGGGRSGLRIWGGGCLPRWPGWLGGRVARL